MLYSRYLWICVLGATFVGCRHPFQAYMRSDVVTYNSAVEDRGPLAEMPVNSGGAGCAAKIALVDVDGLLLNLEMSGFGSVGENPVAMFREKLDRVATDPCYRAVVLRINSPGGGVTASDIMWRDLCTFKARTGLPVVACLMDLGTGGAYYLATPADHIVAHPTTITGGIGVIVNIYNMQDAMAYFNISAAPVKAGVYTDLGTPIEPMTEEGRAVLQRVADTFHARFRAVVQQARPQHDPNRADDFDGRIFTAPEALQRHLIDTIGYLDDAMAIARELSRCPGAQVVMLHRSNDRARSPYATTPNTPLQGGLMPLSIPGFDRSQMPTFLYMWQPEPTLQRRASR